MTSYFVKLIENSPLRDKILRERPSAFCLLTLVVVRARKADLLDDSGNKIQDGIEIGEAMIGDYESYGATEQIYRTDKTYLEKLKILTYRPTSKGTIAKLQNRAVYDIERVKTTDELTTLLTGNQRPTNDQLTTKQEVRSKKKDIDTASTVLSVQDTENLQAIEGITPEDITRIAQLFSISEEDVRTVHQQLRDKAEKGELNFLIKDAAKTLEQWVKKQIEWGKIKPAQTYEEIIREQTGDPNLKIS